MQPQLTRRSFLVGAATLAGAAACSKSSGVIHVAGSNEAAQLNLLITSGAPDGPTSQNEAVFLSGIDQRVGLVLRGQSDFVAPGAGTVSLQFSGDDKKTWSRAVIPDVHSDAGSATVYLTTTARFAGLGTYWVRATYQGLQADAPVIVIDPGTALIPYAGRKIISTPTPLVSDARGVNPICTRTPACPFHQLSVDDALTRHLPIALIFATPLLCQTAVCGPVLNTIVELAPQFAGKVNFVHSEIYTDVTGKSNTPAVLAYHLQSEPVLFLAGADGVVTQRIDGLFGRAEALAGLSKLAGA